MNAEIRRAKQSLRAEWPKLEKYALKKRKGSTQEDIDDKVISSLWLWAKLLYMTLVDTVFRGWSCFDGALKCVCVCVCVPLLLCTPIQF